MNALTEMIRGGLHDTAFTALLFDGWVKSVAVLAVAGGLCLCCRRAAAATRHWIWLLALASLPCLALSSFVPHVWHRPLWKVSTGFDSGNQFSLALDLAPAPETAEPAPVVAPAAPAPASSSEIRAESRQPLVTHFSATLMDLAILLWIGGIVAGVFSMLAGQVRLRRLAADAIRLESPDWTSLLVEACEKLGLQRPVRLLQSAGHPMPITWGGWRPVVLLPVDAADWPVERRRVVLLHELAHAKRWDCLTQTVARVVCAFYWPNPLVWLAARRMCIEREQACDDLVLSSGCRASDYATHLVDIARTFRRTPQLAGIAMARSSQLQGRITAIVDASRARGLRPYTALFILGLIGLLALSVDGGSAGASRKQVEESALRRQQIARLQSFAQAKEKQFRELAAKAGEHVTPEFQSFFDAAVRGQWQTVTNRYAHLKQHLPQHAHATNDIRTDLHTAGWQPVLEIYLAYDQVVNCEPKYTALLADGIIESIPAGSIYFGGTDAGRGVPTAFSKAQMKGDPFFTLTQRALAQNSYLDYLRAMYGGKIYTPSPEDSERCFQEYMADAQRRLQAKQLRPGEDVKIVDGQTQVSGHVAFMAINALLAKLVFDRNPEREFYIEESFPLDWMYPCLEPHGLILKINRTALAELPAEVIARDHEYWQRLVAGILGGWLTEKTTVREVADFVDRVYVRHNLKGFTSDPQFIQNDYAQRTFTKLRSSIAGVYAWRFGPNAPPEYRPKTEAGKQALIREADFSFRQAFALCPNSPEALFRYVQLLMQEQRFDDAILLTETFLKVEPSNKQVLGLLENIRSYKRQSENSAATTNSVGRGVASNKNDRTNEQSQEAVGTVRWIAVENDPLDVYGELLNKTVLMASGLPHLPQSLVENLPADKSSAIKEIEGALSKQGVEVVQDGPHFVRVFRSQMRDSLTNAPLRGAELAQSQEKERLASGTIVFRNIDLGEVMTIYASLVQRTVLRPATLPSAPITLRTRNELTKQEAAYALATTLALNGVCLVEDGVKFVQAVPIQQRALVTTEAPKPEPGAEPISPGQVQFMGADLAQVLTVYGALRNRTILQPANLPRPLVYLKNETALTGEEAAYALAKVFELNGICIVDDGPHFVQLVPIALRSQVKTGAPKPEPGAELLPAGSIKLTGSDLSQALALYGELKHRTVLRPVTLPMPQVSLKNESALTREEAAYALAKVFELNGICVVDDGPHFVQAVPMALRTQVKTGAPQPQPGATLLNPEKILSLGSSNVPNPGTERNENAFQRLLGYYAELAGKTAVPVPQFDRAALWFHVQTPLSKSELLYAIETTFALNGFRIIPVDDHTVRLGVQER